MVELKISIKGESIHGKYNNIFTERVNKIMFQPKDGSPPSCIFTQDVCMHGVENAIKAIYEHDYMLSRVKEK